MPHPTPKLAPLTTNSAPGTRRQPRALGSSLPFPLPLRLLSAPLSIFSPFLHLFCASPFHYFPLPQTTAPPFFRPSLSSPHAFSFPLPSPPSHPQIQTTAHPAPALSSELGLESCCWAWHLVWMGLSVFSQRLSGHTFMTELFPFLGGTRPWAECSQGRASWDTRAFSPEAGKLSSPQEKKNCWFIRREPGFRQPGKLGLCHGLGPSGAQG